MPVQMSPEELAQVLHADEHAFRLVLAAQCVPLDSDYGDRLVDEAVVEQLVRDALARDEVRFREDVRAATRRRGDASRRLRRGTPLYEQRTHRTR